MLAALAPLQAGPLHGEPDDLYSADFPRPSAPVLAQTPGQAPSNSTQPAFAYGEDDYEDLPPLIPSEEDGGRTSMPYSLSLGGDDEGDDEWEEEEDDEDDEYSDEEDEDEDGEDLPPLIGEDSAFMLPMTNPVNATMELTMAAFAQMLQQHVHASGYDDLVNSLPRPSVPTRTAPRNAPTPAPAP